MAEMVQALISRGVIIKVGDHLQVKEYIVGIEGKNISPSQLFFELRMNNPREIERSRGEVKEVRNREIVELSIEGQMDFPDGVNVHVPHRNSWDKQFSISALWGEQPLLTRNEDIKILIHATKEGTNPKFRNGEVYFFTPRSKDQNDELREMKKDKDAEHLNTSFDYYLEFLRTVAVAIQIGKGELIDLS